MCVLKDNVLEDFKVIFGKRIYHIWRHENKTHKWGANGVNKARQGAYNAKAREARRCVRRVI